MGAHTLWCSVFPNSKGKFVWQYSVFAAVWLSLTHSILLTGPCFIVPLFFRKKWLVLRKNQVSDCIIFIIETQIHNLILNQTVWSSNLGRGTRFCLVWNYLDRLWGPSGLLFSGYQGCYPQVKHLGHEVGHSRPSGAEVKNTLSCSTTPSCMPFWHGHGRLYLTKAALQLLLGAWSFQSYSICMPLYRVMKKSLCTWWLYCNRQVHRDFWIILYNHYFLLVDCIHTYSFPLQFSFKV